MNKNKYFFETNFCFDYSTKINNENIFQKFAINYYNKVNSFLKNIKSYKLQKLEVQTISFVLITTFLFTNIYLNTFSFVSNTIDGVSQNTMGRLIQSTNDEEMWNGYVNLGMTKTHILEEDTLEEIQKKVKESCVYINAYNNTGNIETYRRASGFVIKVTSNKIYIATNRHVCLMGNLGPKYGFKVSFEDKEKNDILKENNIKGYITGYSGDFEYGDFGIIELDISSLDYEQRKLFKSVPIDKENIKNETGTIAYFYHITLNGNYELRKTKILPTVPELCFSWAIEKFHLQCSLDSISGDSGSYYFDENGNLVGVLVGMTGKVVNGERIRRDHLLKPSTILDAYEHILNMPFE